MGQPPMTKLLLLLVVGVDKQFALVMRGLGHSIRFKLCPPLGGGELSTSRGHWSVPLPQPAQRSHHHP